MTFTFASGFLVGYVIMASAFSIHLVATYRPKATSKLLISASLVNTGISMWLSMELSVEVVHESLIALSYSFALTPLIASLALLKITTNNPPGSV